MRIRKQKKDRQHNGQKENDKQPSPKQCTQTTNDHETLFLLITSDDAEEE